MSIESKKLLILRILTVLEQYSDSEHPITHSEIIEHIKSDYSTECERKAIGRNILFLKEAGLPIVSSKKGVYLECRLFENSELRLLIDGVLASRHINEKHSKQLIDKLNQLGGIHFKKRNRYIKISEWGKSQNISFFLNVEIIDEAIEKRRQIEFVYNYYDIDKKLYPKKDTLYIVNPYHMLLHNQRYYLVGNMDKYDTITNFRVDRITDIKILDTVVKPASNLPNYDKEMSIAKISCEQPYMFTGNIDYITMIMDKSLIGDIIDWFGDKFTVDPLPNNMVRVRLKANITAMRFWALQYGPNIEIVEPVILRQLIIDDIRAMLSKYKINKI